MDQRVSGFVCAAANTLHKQDDQRRTPRLGNRTINLETIPIILKKYLVKNIWNKYRYHNDTEESDQRPRPTISPEIKRTRTHVMIISMMTPEQEQSPYRRIGNSDISERLTLLIRIKKEMLLQLYGKETKYKPHLDR